MKEAIFVGKLEDILTFQTTDEQSKDDRSKEKRDKIAGGRLYKRLKPYFPFDIITPAIVYVAWTSPETPLI